jgi:hypothetical protein
MEDPFIFSHNFSSLEIPNLIFLPFTFLSYLFSFILSLFPSFSLFFPIAHLSFWLGPFFPPGPAQPMGQMSLSFLLGRKLKPG